jgi:hypothetical protein
MQDVYAIIPYIDATLLEYANVRVDIELPGTQQLPTSWLASRTPDHVVVRPRDASCGARVRLIQRMAAARKRRQFVERGS